MLDILSSSTLGESLSFLNVISVLLASLILGLLVSIIYIKTHKKVGYSASFTVTLIMLPAIISLIILLVGNNVATAFSLAGAFSLIRFRSAPGDPKDISYVFFSLAIGLACGMGYIGYGAVFAIILCGVMVLLNYIKFAEPKDTRMTLKLTVPENLNFQNLCDDILVKYTNSWSLKHVKTSEFGTLFEVVYNINLKEAVSQKKFIDEIRCRNGNLNVTLILRGDESRSSY